MAPGTAGLVEALTASLALLVADSGRGGNPDEGGGIAIIVGIALGLVLVVALVALMLRTRAGRRRGDIFRRRRYRPGRVGRADGRR